MEEKQEDNNSNTVKLQDELPGGEKFSAVLPPDNNTDNNNFPSNQPLVKRTVKDWGKPFVKGDVRINKKGRPKTFDEWRALVQEILQEPAVETDQKGVPLPNGRLTLIKVPKVDGDGLPVVDESGNPVMIDHYATNAELLARKWLRSKDNQQDLVEAGYGKVPQGVDITSGGRSLVQQLPDEEKMRRLQVLSQKALGSSSQIIDGKVVDEPKSLPANVTTDANDAKS